MCITQDSFPAKLMILLYLSSPADVEDSDVSFDEMADASSHDKSDVSSEGMTDASSPDKSVRMADVVSKTEKANTGKRTADARDEFKNCPRVIVFHTKNNSLFNDVSNSDNMTVFPWNDSDTRFLWVEDSKNLNKAQNYVQHTFGANVVLESFLGRSLEHRIAFELYSSYVLEKQSWEQFERSERFRTYMTDLDGLAAEMSAEFEMEDVSEGLP